MEKEKVFLVEIYEHQFSIHVCINLKLIFYS